MERLNRLKLYDTRWLHIVCVNIAIALALAFVFWIVQSKASQHSLSAEIISSLLHAAIYGLFFGFSMPYLSARLVTLSAPWNWAAITASLMLITVLATGLVELCLLGLGYLNAESFGREYFFKSFTVFFIALVIGLSIHLYENYRKRIEAWNLQLRTHELEKERVLKLATEARLASLEAKLHPHFLFNTLNSISALVSEDPLLADKMVQQLSSLLRASLDACERSRTSLAGEIKLVKDYLEIEKVRFRERLKYSIEVEPEILSLQIPPMILQPLVENSIKHAVSPRPEGGEIKIYARLKLKEFVLAVWDDGPGFTAEMIPGGHGLDNLQSRLAVLSGEHASLSVNSQDGGTVVEVSLPLNGLQ
ncbi:MAG TPA: histidine kinase [Pyrinomonadaceae bacterium]|nr:histidine kinase [Pyrinomonadaceae bacterium]